MGIIAAVFALEGGYVNHPSDTGGETNHGITKSVAVANGYTAPMKDMPIEVAQNIYYKDYIKAPNFDLVIFESPVVGEKLVDIGVNTGTPRASRWYQQSLNSMSRGCRDYACITVDGRIGPATIKAHKQLQAKRGKVLSCKLLLRTMEIHQGQHYLNLTNLSDFTVGWISNRIGNVPEERCNNE